MARNTPEFDETVLDAMQRLEDEEVELFLLATASSPDDMDAVCSYNRNGDLVKSTPVRLAATAVAVIARNYEDEPAEVMDTICEHANLLLEDEGE